VVAVDECVARGHSFQFLETWRCGARQTGSAATVDYELQRHYVYMSKRLSLVLIKLNDVSFSLRCIQKSSLNLPYTFLPRPSPCSKHNARTPQQRLGFRDANLVRKSLPKCNQITWESVAETIFVRSRSTNEIEHDDLAAGLGHDYSFFLSTRWKNSNQQRYSHIISDDYLKWIWSI